MLIDISGRIAVDHWFILLDVMKGWAVALTSAVSLLKTVVYCTEHAEL